MFVALFSDFIFRRTRCGKEVLLKTQWMGAWGDGPWGTGLKDKTTPEELAQISRGLGPCQAYVSKMYEEEKSKTGSKSKTFAPGHGVSKFAARKMIPQNFSEVGTTLYTSGVDPAVKYNYPQTTSSVHGWEGAVSVLRFQRSVRCRAGGLVRFLHANSFLLSLVVCHLFVGTDGKYGFVGS